MGGRGDLGGAALKCSCDSHGAICTYLLACLPSRLPSSIVSCLSACLLPVFLPVCVLACLFLGFAQGSLPIGPGANSYIWS